MSQIQAGLYEFLKSMTGQTGGHITDLEMLYLENEGYTTGSIDSRWVRYGADHFPSSYGALDIRANLAFLDRSALSLFSSLTTKPSPSYVVKYDTLIKNLKNQGSTSSTGSTWDRADALYMFSTFSEEAALKNIRNPSVAGTNFSCTFSSSTGYTGNGTSAYVDLGLSPTTIPVVRDNTWIGSEVLAGTNVANAAKVVVSQASGSTIRLAPRGGSSNLTFYINSSNAAATGTMTEVTGTFIGTRTAAGSCTIYKDGVSLGSISAASTSSGVNNNLMLFRHSTTYSDFTVPWLVIGSNAIASGQISNFLAAMAAFRA